MFGGLIVWAVFILVLVPCLFRLTLQAKLGLLRRLGLGAGQELFTQAEFAGQRSDGGEVAER